MEHVFAEIPAEENRVGTGTPGGGTRPAERRPEWLKARIPGGEEYARLHGIMRSHRLHTVCEEARCPNMGECWNAGTATFMILGDTCTRSCGFCAVKTGRPEYGLDWDEPRRVADAVELMGVKHAVITSVNRDERKDGGAPIFAETIRLVRARVPACSIEVLIPDFKGSEEALSIVLDARPDILNHNLETVPRLYRSVRPQANYRQSLEVLERSKRRGFLTKTGLMLGIGERTEEVVDVMKDCRTSGVDILTLGQYLQPTKEHLPIDRYVHPDEFASLKQIALEMGFRHVQSGPLVRSSYHAEQAVETADTR
ncbi:MAG: Lipoyl synthase [Candidatus Uhrbacteria bacterium GW2011_GWC2_53_7]|uniref:Lipoyl synthase n=1 Tax=Candidatus Uhrbacteria bacterium GW2011_GWC2_53_7 TaxID=1618986 RepID=A0A0G2ATD1_9BACT|nr:MAG: Lipoyl synthase [Candidatus Uhrbacteria bacterium GW2011_GWC2_53_7]